MTKLLSKQFWKFFQKFFSPCVLFCFPFICQIQFYLELLLCCFLINLFKFLVRYFCFMVLFYDNAAVFNKLKEIFDWFYLKLSLIVFKRICNACLNGLCIYYGVFLNRLYLLLFRKFFAMFFLMALIKLNCFERFGFGIRSTVISVLLFATIDWLDFWFDWEFNTVETIINERVYLTDNKVDLGML